MAPKPVRGLSRRASGLLPEAQQINFLLEASALLSQSCPQVAAVLGRRALQVADGERAILPRGAATTLCARCGLPFSAEVYQSGQVVKLCRHYIRRKLRAAESSERGGPSQPGPRQVNRAAVIYSCKLCGHNMVRPFYTAAAAHQAVHKAGGPPAAVPAQHQAAPSLGHPSATPPTQSSVGMAVTATPTVSTGAAAATAAPAAVAATLADVGGAKATAGVPDAEAVAVPQVGDVGATTAAAAEATEPLAAQALEASEGGQARAEAACGPAVMPASSNEVAQPLADGIPPAAAPAAAGVCTDRVLEAAKPVGLPHAAEGSQEAVPAQQGMQPPCPSAPVALTTELPAAALPKPPPEPPVQARLDAAASQPPPEQHNSSAGGGAAPASASHPPQAQPARQGGSGAGEPAGSSAPGCTAVPGGEGPANAAHPPGGPASVSLAEAPLLQEQQQQARGGVEAEVPAAIEGAVSSEAASEGTLPAAGEEAAAGGEPGAEGGQPTGGSQSMLVLEPAAFAFNFSLEGAVAVEAPSGAAGPALATAAPLALPGQTVEGEGPSQAGSVPTPAPLALNGAEEEEQEQQPAQKKRRISWSPRLEDVQLIPPASTPPQQLSWAAAEAAIAGGSPGGARVVGRKAWFRVGRRWKCAGM